MDPPERARVFCVDEKSQIQTLNCTPMGVPMKKGTCGTMTHDYRRHGSTTLFAALNALVGSVIESCKDLHRHQEFLSFLNEIAREAQTGLDLHLVLDLYATPEHLYAHKASVPPRPHVVLLDHLVDNSDNSFARISPRRIRRGSFSCVRQLEGAIHRYQKVHTLDRKPMP